MWKPLLLFVLSLCYACSAQCNDYACDSSNLRTILDTNGLTTKDVREVSSVDLSGRITRVNLSGLGIAVIPSCIGMLGEVTYLSLANNRISTLPEEIIQLHPVTLIQDSSGQIRPHPGLYLNNNELCSVSTTVRTWILSYIGFDAGWENSQRCSSKSRPMGLNQTGRKTGKFSSIGPTFSGRSFWMNSATNAYRTNGSILPQRTAVAQMQILIQNQK